MDLVVFDVDGTLVSHTLRGRCGATLAVEFPPAMLTSTKLTAEVLRPTVVPSCR